MQYKDITGQRFGSLVAIRYHHSGVNSANPKHKGLAFWVYKCDCGKEHIARANTVTYVAKKALERNDTQSPSCGCVNLARITRHGYRKVTTIHGYRTQKATHPLYKVYRGIMDRCYNPNAQNYRFYGARGVTICDEWKGNPKAFIEWCLANGWEKGLSVDKDILCERLNIYPQIYSPQTVIFIPQTKNTSFSSGRSRTGINSRLILDWDKCKEIYDLWLDYKNHYSSQNQFHIAMGKKYNCSIGAVWKAIKAYQKRIDNNEVNGTDR